ncbi:MAG: helix-turn-helix transcriptional regulator [Acidimicrobiales bacterium]
MAKTILAQRDMEALLATIAALGDVRPVAALRQDTVELLPPLVATNLVAWNEVDLANGHIEAVTQPDTYSESSAQSFITHMGDHPVIAYQQATRDGRPKAISDFLDAATFHATGIYQHFYRHLGAEDQISFVVPEIELLIGIAMNRDRRGFSERDRTVLNLLRPHLTQAYRNACVFSRMEATITNVQALAEHSNESIVLLDHHRNIELLSSRAAVLLLAWFNDWNGAQLPAALGDWLVESQRRPGPPWPFVLEHDQRRLLVRRLTVGSGEALVLSEPSRERTVDLIVSLGLTNREAQVMALITRGASTADIATRLGIRPPTVYKHVERSLKKLGASSRVEAVNLILQARSLNRRPT